MRRLLSTDVSHINLPPLAHVELSSESFALPLSFTSALRVISSAIWSIASQIKNALLVTNLIISSQKYVASQKLRPTGGNVKHSVTTALFLQYFLSGLCSHAAG